MIAETVSGLYSGAVAHTRFKPRRHSLTYRVFMLLLDLDELPELNRRLRLFSVDRFNLTGVSLQAHGDGSATPLKTQLEARLAAAGLAAGGPIRMLCLPHILGRGFNPLTVFYCHDAEGRLSAILYEVNNTFGERHAYLIPASSDAGGVVRQACDKAFYVSPFMDMDLSYAFRLRPPDATVVTAIEVRDARDVVLAAGFTGARRELTDAALFKAWLTHPWMTLGALAAIHLEAAKIWLKGGRIRHRIPTRGPGLTTVTPPARLGAGAQNSAGLSNRR